MKNTWCAGALAALLVLSLGGFRLTSAAENVAAQDVTKPDATKPAATGQDATGQQGPSGFDADGLFDDGLDAADGGTATGGLEAEGADQSAQGAPVDPAELQRQFEEAYRAAQALAEQGKFAEAIEAFR